MLRISVMSNHKKITAFKEHSSTLLISHSKTTVEMVACASKQKSSEIRMLNSSVQNPYNIPIILVGSGWLIEILVIYGLI